MKIILETNKNNFFSLSRASNKKNLYTEAGFFFLLFLFSKFLQTKKIMVPYRRNWKI